MSSFSVARDIFLPHAATLAALGLLLLFLFSSVKRSNSIYNCFPRLSANRLWGAPIHKLVENGYYQIIKKTQMPFVVWWWAGDFIVMPPKYLKDVRGAGWSHLSFFESISNALFLHTSVGDLYTSKSSYRMVEVIQKGLNPKLPHLTPMIIEEIEFSLKTLLSSSGWKEVRAMNFFGELVHRIATRLLLCKELCRDETFIRRSMSFQESIFVTALVIAKLPLGPFRRILSWPISSLHRRKLRQCMDMLHPVVKKRLEWKSNDPNHTKEPDAIQWTLDLSLGEDTVVTEDWLVKELLHNLWAGSSAPGGMLTEIIYHLLLHPEHLEPLRREAEHSVDQYGWSEQMLNSLHLQDSFIRETNRLFPTGSLTCVRTVLGEPFRFSDGLTLPVGARFGFPAQAIQHDPDSTADALKFKGFRFAEQNVRDSAMGDGEKRRSASSVDTSYFPWGYGNHVCVGRFFAVRMMKLIITKLLLEYDIKWDKRTNDRPPPVHVEGQFVPNTKQNIALRRRSSLA